MGVFYNMALFVLKNITGKNKSWAGLVGQWVSILAAKNWNIFNFQQKPKEVHKEKWVLDLFIFFFRLPGYKEKLSCPALLLKSHLRVWFYDWLMLICSLPHTTLILFLSVRSGCWSNWKQITFLVKLPAAPVPWYSELWHPWSSWGNVPQEGARISLGWWVGKICQQWTWAWYGSNWPWKHNLNIIVRNS